MVMLRLVFKLVYYMLGLHRGQYWFLSCFWYILMILLTIYWDYGGFFCWRYINWPLCFR